MLSYYNVEYLLPTRIANPIRTKLLLIIIIDRYLDVT